MKKVVAIIVIIGIVLAGFFGYRGIRSYLDLKKYQQQIEEIKIENVDLESVPDGMYIGKAEVLWIAAEVKVIVQDHKIVNIDLIKHKNERGKSAEVIPQKVIETQSLQVDAVSGATNSSKVILKAIENALENSGAAHSTEVN